MTTYISRLKKQNEEEVIFEETALEISRTDER